MEVQWRSVVGWEGLYEVSNDGRVRSIAKGQGRRSKVLSNRGGNYYSVALYRDGKAHYYLISRLVAQAFIPNPNNFGVVNHLDENPHNNCVSNLEWCTQKHNANWGTARMRLSRALKGRVVSESEREHHRIASLGKTHTEESKKKISEAIKHLWKIGHYDTAHRTSVKSLGKK